MNEISLLQVDLIMAAPEGNQNAKKGTEWRQAIKRALAHKAGTNYRDGLDLVATKLVDAALAGDQWAIREIGDREDGKPIQASEISGPDGGDIPLSGIVKYVKPSTE